jgi:hypothetical protein
LEEDGYIVIGLASCSGRSNAVIALLEASHIELGFQDDFVSADLAHSMIHGTKFDRIDA